MSIFKRKINIEEVKTPEELLMNLPKWSIAQSKPRQLFTNPKKDYIQCVFLSKVIGMKAIWMELDGMGRIKTDTRAYRVPKQNLYGDVFIYDMDKKQCINELISVDREDEEDSHKELQTANMYYMLGKLAGLNDFFGKLGNITILLILTLLAALLSAGVTYMSTKDIVPLLEQIIATMPIKDVPIVVGGMP